MNNYGYVMDYDYVGYMLFPVYFFFRKIHIAFFPLALVNFITSSCYFNFSREVSTPSSLSLFLEVSSFLIKHWLISL